MSFLLHFHVRPDAFFGVNLLPRTPKKSKKIGKLVAARARARAAGGRAQPPTSLREELYCWLYRGLTRWVTGEPSKFLVRAMESTGHFPGDQYWLHDWVVLSRFSFY